MRIDTEEPLFSIPKWIYEQNSELQYRYYYLPECHPENEVICEIHKSIDVNEFIKYIRSFSGDSYYFEEEFNKNFEKPIKLFTPYILGNYYEDSLSSKTFFNSGIFRLKFNNLKCMYNFYSRKGGNQSSSWIECSHTGNTTLIFEKEEDQELEISLRVGLTELPAEFKTTVYYNSKEDSKNLENIRYFFSDNFSYHDIPPRGVIPKVKLYISTNLEFTKEVYNHASEESCVYFQISAWNDYYYFEDNKLFRRIGNNLSKESINNEIIYLVDKCFQNKASEEYKKKFEKIRYETFKKDFFSVDYALKFVK
jgi:hypothetical protein